LVITIYFSLIPILLGMVAHRLTYAENKKEFIIPIVCCLLLTSIVSAIVLALVNPTGFKKIEEKKVEDFVED